MGEKSVYYWEKYLQKDMNKKITPNGYILKFSIINYDAKKIFNGWFNFNIEEDLISFIKYVVLPSTYLSKTHGMKNDDIYLYPLNYEDMMNILNYGDVYVDEKTIKEFDNYYKRIDVMGKDDKATFKQIENFCFDLGRDNPIDNNVFITIKAFENIQSVGKVLVKDYENHHMLDILENGMGMSKDEILAMFENIKDNPFMIRKINQFLTNKVLIL